MNRATPPSAEALLEHAGFLRAIARTLVFDEGQADDVVQDALAVALERRPSRPAHLRAWLAGVTRNLARKRQRTEGRLRRRERAAARPEATDATADVVARLELQRAVVEQVRHLEEPHRTVIVLRYFDELKPRAIARELGVSVRTVETRLRRGIAQLRARLDTAHGGDRRAWSLGLVALVPLHKMTAPTATAATVSGVTMSTKATIGMAGALVATFFVGWMARPDRSARDGARATGGDVVARAEYERVRRALAEEQERNRALAEQLGAAATPSEDAAATVETGGPAAKRSGPRFVYAGYDKALAGVDWEVVGEALHAMPPIMAELVDALKNGKPIPPSVGDLQRWNGPLLKEGIKLKEAGIPGTGVNGTFTHPAVMVNLINAALEKGGKSLTEEQAGALQEIGARFVDEDRRRTAGYGADVCGLRKLMEEAGLKDRFFDEVKKVLGEEQRGALWPEASKGLLNFNVFSSGLTVGQHARAVGFSSREDLAKQFQQRVVSALSLDPSAAATLRPLVESWAAGFSDDWLAEPYTDAVRKRVFSATRTREAALQQLKLQQAILERVPLTDKQRAELLASTLVLVPYRAP